MPDGKPPHTHPTLAEMQQAVELGGKIEKLKERHDAAKHKLITRQADQLTALKIDHAAELKEIFDSYPDAIRKLVGDA